ncbi:unnamed protein product [Rhodiola kirilowii]
MWDDLIFTGNHEGMIKEFKNSMMRVFEMKDLGLMRYYLGIELFKKLMDILICQRKYASEILKRFGMDESQAVRTPMVPGHKLCKDEEGKAVCETYFKQVIGSLMYLTATRPDLMYSVSLISRFMSRPTEMHMQAAKRIMRYIKGTLSYGILYRHDKSHMVGYTDSDYAGDIDDRKSTSGYVFMMSFRGHLMAFEKATYSYIIYH